MAILNPVLHSSPVVTRYPGNPILTAADVPYPADLVFNAGVALFQGRYVMVFRDDYGYDGTDFTGTTLGVAFSDDGVRWSVRDRPLVHLADVTDGEITRIYDPRLTVLDGRCHLCFAVDTRHGLRGGIGVTDDFETIDIVSMSAPDNRNMVLFPERIDDMYVRLERPMPVYSRGGVDRFDAWISRSPDLRYWGDSSLLLPVEQVPFANDKVGPGAPPVRTDRGWLTLFHAVDIDASRGRNGWESSWTKRYCAGVMLLDLDDPRRIVGISREPLLAPETRYETGEGFRENVIFPGGMILEPSGEVKIYYGASDTVECLATADVGDLLALCRSV